MAKIAAIIHTPGLNGYYFDDQRAIKSGAKQDGFFYVGAPLTPGFRAIREPGRALCLTLVSDEGWAAFGDCTSVQYPGVAGRDPVSTLPYLQELLTSAVIPRLQGSPLDSFRRLARETEDIRWEGNPLPLCLRYGVSQALLHAVAESRRRTMTEVLLEEYGLPLVLKAVPIYIQTGDDRYVNAEKAIMKRADVLPHGSFNEVATKVGRNGELLLEYVLWLKNRVQTLGDAEYRPVFHFDLYGTPSLIFGEDIERIAAFLCRLEQAAAPHSVQAEAPVFRDDRSAHLEAFASLRRTLSRMGSRVRIVADEWCNTLEDIAEFARLGVADMLHIKTPDLGGIQNSVEAVLTCRAAGVSAFLGGTCTDTDQSARVAVHMALATQPAQMLAKPGMAVDEGLMIVSNEMGRTLAFLAQRAQKQFQTGGV